MPPLQSEFVHFVLVLLCLAAVFRFILTYKRSCKLARQWGCQPAQNMMLLKDPVLGLDFLLESLFGEGTEHYVKHAHTLLQKLGSTYVARRLTLTSVYTCDSQNIKHVLADDFDSFALPVPRVAALSSVLGWGIFALQGHSWSFTRRTLRPLLSRDSVGSHFDSFESHFQTLQRRIPRDGSTVDLQPIFFWLAMDIATDFLTGSSTNMLRAKSVGGKEQQFVEDYIMCSAHTVKRMQAGPLRHFVISSEARKARDRVCSYIDHHMDEALSRKSSASTALEKLREVTRDRTALRDQFLHLLLASRDTSASLLSNFFFVLARDPERFAKLRAEVLRVAGTQPPSQDSLKQMEYLRWCIQESLRLHPVIPTNAREACQDTTLPRGGGKDGLSPLFVRRGTVVLYNIYSMHRNEAAFGADVEQFRPERWKDLRPGWNYLPFNGGPRICIGQQFALAEVSYIIARLVQCFEKMDSRDHREWVESYSLAVTCKQGVHVGMFGDEAVESLEA